MEAADTARYQPLRSKMEQEWVPQMQELLGIDTSDLPVIWDADFLYGPKNDAGDDTYVLCEVNVSAVWPFPPQATHPLAAAAGSATRHMTACSDGWRRADHLGGGTGVPLRRQMAARRLPASVPESGGLAVSRDHRQLGAPVFDNCAADEAERP